MGSAPKTLLAALSSGARCRSSLYSLIYSVIFWRNSSSRAGAVCSVCPSGRTSQYSERGRHSSRRSEEHTSELQSLAYLVCRLLLEKIKIHHALVLLSFRRGLYARIHILRLILQLGPSLLIGQDQISKPLVIIKSNSIHSITSCRC